MTQTNENYLAPALPEDLEARADHLVSAGRIFSAALRTARAMRMPPARALQAAVACALHHTGIDWSAELGPDSLLVADAAVLSTDEFKILEFHESWKSGELGFLYRPALMTDLYQAYLAFCAKAKVTPAILPKFVHTLTGALNHKPRQKRWYHGGELHGPNSFFWPPFSEHETILVGGERDWLGGCVASFRSTLNFGGNSLQ